MSRTLWIPAENLNAARMIAYAVDAGRLPMMPHYASEEAAETRASLLTETHARTILVFAIVMERRATHDGFIPVARVIDGSGSVAAALLIVVGGSFAVGFATLV